eukprot:5100589-Amphidinium_carterae.1
MMKAIVRLNLQTKFPDVVEAVREKLEDTMVQSFVGAFVYACSLLSLFCGVGFVLCYYANQDHNQSCLGGRGLRVSICLKNASLECEWARN